MHRYLDPIYNFWASRNGLGGRKKGAEGLTFAGWDEIVKGRRDLIVEIYYAVGDATIEKGEYGRRVIRILFDFISNHDVKPRGLSSQICQRRSGLIITAYLQRSDFERQLIGTRPPYVVHHFGISGYNQPPG